MCLLCSIRVLVLVKYDLVLRYEARVNALRASSFFTGPQVQLLHSGVANASSKLMPVSKEYDNFNWQETTRSQSAVQSDSALYASDHNTCGYQRN